MSYENPHNPERHVHPELFGLVYLLGISARAEAAARLQATQGEADELWFGDPICLELEKLEASRDQQRQRSAELDAEIANEKRKSQEATRTGCYSDLRATDARLKELQQEQQFLNNHNMTLMNDREKLQRKAGRIHQDIARKFAAKVRVECEADHAAKMGELLTMIRSRPDMMELVTQIAVIDVIHVNFLP